MSSISTAHFRRIRRGTKMYLILILLLGGILSYYSWNYYNILSDAKALLSTQQTVKADMAEKKSDSEMLYKAAQEETLGLYESRQKALKNIFPQEEAMTVLTRALDKFFLENNYKSQPFLLDSLSFDEVELLEDNDYAILPFSINASGSRRNIDKFLNYIETSGSTASEVRLMTVDSLSLSFSEDSETGEELISMSGNLSAYFQKPPE